MLFNSYTFLAFFAVVLAVHHGTRIPWAGKKSFLLVASYLFYAAWNPPFVILIWFSTVVDWHLAKKMAATDDPRMRRLFLIGSLTANLGLLGYFKYGGFLLETFIGTAALVGVQFQPATWSIVLPVGISFYTFQTLSYTIDVYRGNIEPSDSFLDFALFVTFFPQLVAGPIVRAADFLPQLAEERRASSDQLGWGLTLLTIGLFAKVVLADSWMAPVADQVYDAAHLAGFLDAWVGTLAFSAQIFYDFAGYSTCAIAAALCLGFVLPDNFRFPYAAVGFSDFWRRWHISLSSWLRDYLYIPLGGNRRGPIRTYINLMITMLLGGLWHGAAWRFVVWGALHGGYLAVERFLSARGIRFPGPAFLAALLTHVLVLFTWVYFRAETFEAANQIVLAMIGLRADALTLGVEAVLLVAGTNAVLLAAHWFLRDRSVEWLWGFFRPAVRAALITAMLLAITMSQGNDRAFIYFQF
ncbi:MAG: MBOAT family O-acyltransferase [Longimicrobiales bacterium]